MTNQEKWILIVEKIENLGGELQEIFESLDETKENYEDINMSLNGLRMSVEELYEQDLE